MWFLCISNRIELDYKEDFWKDRSGPIRSPFRSQGESGLWKKEFRKGGIPPSVFVRISKSANLLQILNRRWTPWALSGLLAWGRRVWGGGGGAHRLNSSLASTVTGRKKKTQEGIIPETNFWKPPGMWLQCKVQVKEGALGLQYWDRDLCLRSDGCVLFKHLFSSECVHYYPVTGSSWAPSPPLVR